MVIGISTTQQGATMANYGSMTVKGESGNNYTFNVYGYDTIFKPLCAVYLITKRTLKPDGGGSHNFIYIGETEDLSDRFNGHHKKQCFINNNANCKCVHLEDNKNTRLQIESDILGNYSFPCND